MGRNGEVWEHLTELRASRFLRTIDKSQKFIHCLFFQLQCNSNYIIGLIHLNSTLNLFDPYPLFDHCY